MSTNTEVIEVAAEVIDQKDVAAANAILTIKPEVFAKQVFAPFKTQLAAAVRAANKDSKDLDIQTKAGMEVAKLARRTFKTIRTTVENTRKERKAPIIEIGRLLDDQAKAITATIVPHEDKFDSMIKAEETRLEAIKQAELAKERARIEAIENRLQRLRSIASMHLQSDSAAIARAIDEHSTVALEPAEYEEFYEEAQNIINAAIVELQRMHKLAAEREEAARVAAAEKAELERLRAEQAAAAERQRQEEARQRAEAERLAAEQRQRDAEARAQAEAQAKLIADLQAQLAAAQAPKVEPAPEPDPEPTTYAQLHALLQAKHDAAPLALVDDVPEYRGADADAAADVVDADFLEVAAAHANDAAVLDLLPATIPTKADILAVLAAHYDEDEGTIAGWLHGLFGNGAA